MHFASAGEIFLRHVLTLPLALDVGSEPRTWVHASMLGELGQ